MKNTKYITQYEYQKQLEQEKVFVKITIATILYGVSLTLFWMSLL
jgi:hypothetical protein